MTALWASKAASIRPGRVSLEKIDTRGGGDLDSIRGDVHVASPRAADGTLVRKELQDAAIMDDAQVCRPGDVGVVADPAIVLWQPHR